MRNETIIYQLTREDLRQELRELLAEIRTEDDADRKRDIQEYLISRCRSLLGEANMANDEDVKCAAALGKRRFILEVMPGAILAYEQLQEIHRKAEKRADRKEFLRRLIRR